MPRIAAIAQSVDAVLENGTRSEVLRLIALLAGRFAVAKIRAEDLRASQHHACRDLTVKQAVQEYPISSSFLYEHGEELGIAHKTAGGKVTVIETNLRKYLEGK